MAAYHKAAKAAEDRAFTEAKNEFVLTGDATVFANYARGDNAFLAAENLAFEEAKDEFVRTGDATVFVNYAQRRLCLQRRRWRRRRRRRHPRCARLNLVCQTASIIISI